MWMTSKPTAMTVIRARLVIVHIRPEGLWQLRRGSGGAKQAVNATIIAWASMAPLCRRQSCHMCFVCANPLSYSTTFQIELRCHHWDDVCQTQVGPLRTRNVTVSSEELQFSILWHTLHQQQWYHTAAYAITTYVGLLQWIFKQHGICGHQLAMGPCVTIAII